MNKVKLYNIEGKESGEFSLPDFFATEINEGILHEVATAELANKRITTAHTKTRGKISGGGKKPWKQKGTGRARAGSNRSPLWRGGGITFGPLNEQNFSKKINRKVKKLALKMAYANKLNDSAIAVMENLNFENPKTKKGTAILSNLPFEKGSVLIASTSSDKNSSLVFRNIANINIETISSVSVVDLMKHKNLVITKQAIEELEKIFSEKTKEKSEIKAEVKPKSDSTKNDEENKPAKKKPTSKTKKVKDE